MRFETQWLAAPKNFKRRREAFDGYPFKSDRQKDCVQLQA